MQKPSFLLSLRTLWRNRTFSILNILGLTIGICASIIIFLVVYTELSFDNYHSKRDRIYRIVTSGYEKSGEVVFNHSWVNIPLARTLRAEMPGLEKVAAVQPTGQAQVYIPVDGKEEKRFLEPDGAIFTEPDIYKIFDFTWLAGSTDGLTAPNTAVISATAAHKYFGSPDNAIGKTIQLWSFRIPLNIIGVFKDLPENTDLPISIGASYATYLKNDGFAKHNYNNWRAMAGGSQCFVLAGKNTDMEKLQAQMPAFVNRNFLQRTPSDPQTVLQFQPLKSLHLDSRFGKLNGGGLSKDVLYALSVVGLFLIIVACINFINLATAQSLTRAKQVGIQKVLGSSNAQLMWGFFRETAILTGFALILGAFMAWAVLPGINQVLGKTLPAAVIYSPGVLVFLLLLGVVITFLAGSYPAMVLTRFNPVEAIKNKISSRSVGGISIRRALVVFQFVVAQLLIIGTLVVMKQMNFFINRPMGYQKEAIVTVDLPSDSLLSLKYQHLRQSFLQIKGVEDATLCTVEPTANYGRYEDVYFDADPERQKFTAKQILGDTSYFNTFRLTMAAGRMPYASDTVREVVVNETLVKKLGLKSAEEIIGRNIGFEPGKRYPVVGVLKDFNNKTLREGIEPMVFTTNSRYYGMLVVRLDPASISPALDRISKVFSEIYPTYIYQVSFFDETLRNFYRAEKTTGKLFYIATLLAITISCLGLYGLINFMTIQRTREIGIRKVLGASVQSIVYLFSKEFTVLVLLAFIVAAPIGYLVMSKWLSGFYFHTDIGWQVFVGAVLCSVLISLVTVGSKAIRAATTDPVKSLKNRG